MISRRLLRIKALLILYAFNRKEADDLEVAEKELIISIDKTFELYHLILLLILDIADVANEKIELARNKKIPNEIDLNPNLRFVENRLLKQLSLNSDLQKYIREKKLSWSSYSELPRKLYNQMIIWDEYKKYMSADTAGYSEDKKFINKLLAELILKSDDLESALEEQSIYWNDDLDFVTMMIEKTFRSFKAGTDEKVKLMGLYKNSEDEEFVKTLLRKVILHSDKYTQLIDSNTTNWEIERIALMDTLVMRLAITELVQFEEIPVKVTLNEYIEIAKFYCTAKSGIFVNGILDKIVREMREKNLFVKRGRGLIGEPGFESEKS
jgi:N utilization substance protein B